MGRGVGAPTKPGDLTVIVRDDSTIGFAEDYRPEIESLVRANASRAPGRQLPIEILGNITMFIKPDFKGGPYPGKERQRDYWRDEHERQSDEALAAMKGGRRKTRKTRRRQTRRRK